MRKSREPGKIGLVLGGIFWVYFSVMIVRILVGIVGNFI